MFCMSLTCFDLFAFDLQPVYLSVDVTGALVLLIFWCLSCFSVSCVSVRRRGRCTRTLSFRFFVLLFWFVCMSPNLYNDTELPYTPTKVKRTIPSKARFVPPSVPLVVFWSP